MLQISRKTCTDVYISLEKILPTNIEINFDTYTIIIKYFISLLNYILSLYHIWGGYDTWLDVYLIKFYISNVSKLNSEIITF